MRLLFRLFVSLSHSSLITFILAIEISLSFLLFRTLAIMKVRFAESDGIVYRVIMTIRASYGKAFAPFILRDDTKGDSIHSE